MLAFILAVPASAQEGRPPVTPRAAPVVAGPTASGARLVAFDDKRRLCADLRIPGVGRSLLADCDRPSGRLREPFLGSASVAEADTTRRFEFGFVAPEVASVELVYRSGKRVTAPAEAGERYKGRFAGKGRFFIAEVRGRGFRSPVYLRLLGEAGELLAVVEGEGAFLPRGAGPTVRLASGRVGTARWRLTAQTQRQFAPVPGDEERFETLTCTELGGSGSPTSAQTCVGESETPTALSIGRGQGCSPFGAAVTGIVSKETRRVEAVLGDGSRRRLALFSFPPRFKTDRRAFSLALETGVAARRLLVYGPKGPPRSQTLELAPGSIRCGLGGAFLAFAFADDPPRPRPDSDGPDFLVRDRGALLCLAIDAFDPEGRDCDRPPLRSFASHFVAQAGPRGTLVGGVVPQEVTAVQFELDGGERRRIEATTEGPYEGRYRGLVRFVTLPLTGRRKAYSARLLDDLGRVIEEVPGPDSRPLDAPYRTIARIGHLRLGVAVGRPYSRGTRVPCLELTAAAYTRDSAFCGAFPDIVDVRAFCSSRRIVLSGLVGAGVRSVSLRTSRGLIRGRIIPLPAAFRIKRSVLLVTVPADEAPREIIRTDRRRTVRQPLKLPPAARQCGYEDFNFFERSSR